MCAVVENYSLIQCAAGFREKYVARVCIAHDCDLAILLVEEPNFWAGLPLSPSASACRAASEVVAVGFSVGGDDVAVVSRIRRRAHRQPVRATTSRSIGNSGGPSSTTSASSSAAPSA